MPIAAGTRGRPAAVPGPYFVLSPAETYGLARHEHSYDFGMRLDFQPGRLDDVPDLRWVDERDVPSDWVMTVDAVRLVSPRVKQVLDAFITERDDVQWLPGVLATPDGREHDYFVPHFATWHDLLDKEATDRGPGGPIRWVLSASQADGPTVFTLPQMAHIVIVTSEVLEALKASGASGYDVDPARVVGQRYSGASLRG